jgi:hypothetical protein
MSEQHEIHVRTNGPRPSFGEVAEFLWGRNVDFDSDGNSTSPDDPNWTELTLERRDGPLERVDIYVSTEVPLVLKVVASSFSLSRRAAEFLRERTHGSLVGT